MEARASGAAIVNDGLYLTAEVLAKLLPVAAYDTVLTPYEKLQCMAADAAKWRAHALHIKHTAAHLVQVAGAHELDAVSRRVPGLQRAEGETDEAFRQRILKLL